MRKHPGRSLCIIVANIIKFSFIIKACKHLAKGRLIFALIRAPYSWCKRRENLYLSQIIFIHNILLLSYFSFGHRFFETTSFKYSTTRLNMINAHCQQSPVVYCNEKKLYHFRIFEFKSEPFCEERNSATLLSRSCDNVTQKLRQAERLVDEFSITIMIMYLNFLDWN